VFPQPANSEWKTDVASETGDRKTKEIHTQRTHSLCKLKQMFRKSQEPQTQNEAKLWEVSQEKAAKYLMFK
jgi:hypothetical protein